MVSDSLDVRAQNLLREVVTSLKSNYGFTSMAFSIYDTAWLAMITKSSDNGPNWLFPECFTFLLEKQRPDGSWDLLENSNRQSKYQDCIAIPDTILHTLAGLLALSTHVRQSQCGGCDLPSDIELRIGRAKSFLDIQLAKWDIEKTTHFGFELLVPVLFYLLQGNNILFHFPQKQELENRYSIASKLDIDWLYVETCKVPLFSLEALIGKLDFSRLSHQISPAGMMASPASTAAYLIYAPTWSDECEAYLRHILLHGQGNGNGGVPGVFPLTTFESSWVCLAWFSSEELLTGYSCRSYQPCWRMDSLRKP